MADNIAKILKDQRALEDRYQQLVQEQGQLKALPNKSQFKQGQLAILDVGNELDASTQILAKRLKAHPSVAQNLLKIQQERSTLQTLISKTLRELKEFRFESLVLAVEEEYKKKNTLQNTINRENESSELLKDLQRELLNEKKLLEDEANDRNQVIQQLKDTIQEINALTSSEQKYVRKEIKAHESSVRQQCQSKEQALLELKNTLIQKIDLEKRVHEKTVDFLSRQKEEMERSIQDWMTKYEEDVESKTNELESLKQTRTLDLDKFEELLAAYEEIEKVVEEDKQEKARLAEEERILKMKEKACQRLQRWWKRILQKRAEAKVSYFLDQKCKVLMERFQKCRLLSRQAKSRLKERKRSSPEFLIVFFSKIHTIFLIRRMSRRMLSHYILSKKLKA